MSLLVKYLLTGCEFKYRHKFLSVKLLNLVVPYGFTCIHVDAQYCYMYRFMSPCTFDMLGVLQKQEIMEKKRGEKWYLMNGFAHCL